MPNYNYRSNDYMRRGQCQRPVPVMRTEPEYTIRAKEHIADIRTSEPLKEMPVAMAYVPWQEWNNLYPVEKALCRGTIFEKLDKPFQGIGGCCK